MSQKAQKPKINKQFLNSVKLTSEGDEFIWDRELKGFGLKVTPNGISYIAQGRVNGKAKRITIGKHGTFTPDQARAEAADRLRDMRHGIDPVKMKKSKKIESQTLAQVAETYKSNKRTREGFPLKENTKKDIDRHLSETFKDWKDRPLSALTRDMVSKRYVEAAKNSIARANQGFRILRALYNWERKRTKKDSGDYVLANNPVDILTDLEMWGHVPTRNSKIPVEKMGKAWLFLKERRSNPALSELSRTATELVMLMVLTGLRKKEEAASLTWKQLDLKDESLHLPDPKNRMPVIIPISTQLAGMLKERPKENDFVFPSHSKTGHIVDVRDCLELISKEISENSITSHDLRRTFRAVAIKAGVEDYKIKLLMNHKLSSSDAAFASYTEKSDVRYLREDTQKISDWIERQASISSTEKVIDLEHAKAKSA